jgi:hypothetical protein
MSTFIKQVILTRELFIAWEQAEQVLLISPILDPEDPEAAEAMNDYFLAVERLRDYVRFVDE